MTRKLVYGIGTNDADYVVAKSEKVAGKWRAAWRCPAYSAWKHMLERAFSKSKKISHPTYIGVTVCEEWLVFSKFKSWWDINYKQDYHLDKDILVSGNKEYSPDKCIYVPSWINSFIAERGAMRGDWPIGVSWSVKYELFESYISIKGRKKFLGHFSNPQSAHLRWVNAKLELVHKYKEEFDNVDERIYPALVKRYTNYE